MQTSLGELQERFQGSAAIAVVGVGCLFPDADHGQQFWDNIQKGKDSIGPVPLSHWKPEDYFDADPKRPDHTYAKTGGFLKPYMFDPLQFGLAPHTLEATDTTQLLGMVAAHQALVDAGYGPDRDFDRNRVSCLLGVTGTLELVIPLGARLGHPIWKKALARAGIPDELSAQILDDVAASYVPWQENSFPGLLGNVVAGRIANRFDLGGSNSVVDAACASSLAALHMAMMELESGRSDMVISGGMDTFNDIFMYMCFSKTPALSPTGHARPFDAEGDGTILGEGLGAVILKRLDDAIRDGDRVYAVIRGMGSASDGKGQAIYAPSAAGQVKALQRAYERAGVEPQSIGLLEAHGTGTKVGDGVELDALKQVYGPSEGAQARCQLGSVKSQIGHTKAAAGAAGLIKAVMALHHKVLPPTLKVQQAHPKLAGTPFVLDDKPRPWISLDGPRRAAVSAFGFGGSNYHCVLEEVSPEKKSVAWDPQLCLGLFSAADDQALALKLATALEQWAYGHARATLLRQWRKEFRTEDPCRLGVGADSEDGFQVSLQEALAILPSSTRTWPTGTYYASGPVKGPLAFIFAGQGSQSPGMLRDLACRFPEFHESLEAGEAVLRQHEGSESSLSALIYPVRDFSADAAKVQTERLTATRYAQLSLGTLGLAAIKTLRRFGVEADMYAGHSFGELLALYAAGSWDERQLLEAAYARGRLMSEQALPNGAMLAVMAPAAKIEEWLSTSNLDLVVANRNAPEQLVLGGSKDAVEAAQKQLKALRISCKRLEVSSAFHTRFVSAAVPHFHQVLRQHPLKLSKKPVFSNKSGLPYGQDPELMQELLAQQIGAPVVFADMLDNMQSQGLGTVVEIGPGRKLQGLLKAGLGSDVHVLALDAQGDGSVRGLAHLLLQLAVLGYPLSWEAWQPGDSQWASPRGQFQVAISGANYRSKPKEKNPLPPKTWPRGGGQGETGKIPAVPATQAPEPSSTPSTTQSQVSTVEARSRIDIPRAAASAARQTPGEQSVPKLEDLQRLEKVLQDMQDLQRRTTEAHTLFLENQRQFQSMLRGVLFQDVATSPQSLLPSAAQPDSFRSQTSSFQAPAAQPREVVPSVEQAPAKPIASEVQQVAREVSVAPEAVAKTPAQDQANLISSASEVKTLVLETIARTTGYPIELLQDSMSLEADLGIDSIKKVEIFSQLQTEFPRLTAEASAMNALQTIHELIQLCDLPPVTAKSPQLASAEGTRIGAWAAGTVAFAASENAVAADRILEIVADKTGFPREMLSPALDLEGDLGIDSIKKVEIFSSVQEQFPQLAGLGSDSLNQLRTIADLQGLLHEAPSSGHAEAEASAPNIFADLKAHILQIVAERTGYPLEVLQLEMDLESDLGIDSIKRVEIISALSEALPIFQNIPQENLAHVKTLGDLVGFTQNEDGVAASLLEPLSHESWDLSGKKKQNEPPTLGHEIDERAEDLSHLDAPDAERIFDAKVDRQWLETLDAWTLEAQAFEGGEPAVSLRPEAEVWVVDDGSNLARNMMLKLQDKAVQVRLISLAMQERLQVSENLQGVFLLAPIKFDHHAHRWYLQALKLLKKVGPQLQNPQGFFVTISRHGGLFGLDGLSQMSQVFAGGVAAFAKTIAHEWPGVHARALDLAKDFTDGFEAAQRCIDAALSEGPLEMGVGSQQLWQLQLREQQLGKEVSAPSEHLEEGALILVTGGARGVTAASLRPLAARYRPHFVIWGRTPLTDDGFDHFSGLQDPAAIKRRLLEHDSSLQHPRDLEQAYRNLLQQKEIRDTIEGLRELGAKVSYQLVDVSKEGQLREAADSLTQNWGVPQGIIHGAGVIRDKFLLEQKEDEFLEVIDTKLRILPIFEQWVAAGTRWVVLFSSSTARLGRKGQLAYGIANEVLNKFAAYLSAKGALALAFNWGPWDGGMVHDSLKKLFAAEGVGTIPLEAGALLLREVLERGESGAREWMVLAKGSEHGTVVATATQQPELASIEVDLNNTPILADHILKHHAVVPAALILEWMATAVHQEHPTLRLACVEEFMVWKGITLAPDQSRQLRSVIKSCQQSEQGVHAEVELISVTGKDEGRAHARARLLWQSEVGVDLGYTSLEAGADSQFLPLKIYEEVLFHGQSLALLEDWVQVDAEQLMIHAQLKGQPQEWSLQGLEAAWNTSAPLLDAVFQAAIVWSHIRLGQKCLPNRLSGWQLARPLPESGRVILKLSLLKQESHHLRFAVEIADEAGLICSVLECVEMVTDASLVHSFAQNHFIEQSEQGSI